MVPCCTAVKVSPQAIGTALPPSEENMPMYTGFCITRYLTPCTSSGFSTGRTLLIMLRKPPSKKPISSTPFFSSLPASFLPTGPSSTCCACGSLPNRNGRSLSWNAGSICAMTALVMAPASTVPRRMPSIIGFSSPSCRLGKCWTSMRPFERASTSFLNSRAPTAYGSVSPVELVQPNLMTVFCASAGDCTSARPSASPVANFQIFMSVPPERDKQYAHNGGREEPSSEAFARGDRGHAAVEPHRRRRPDVRLHRAAGRDALRVRQRAFMERRARASHVLLGCAGRPGARRARRLPRASHAAPGPAPRRRARLGRARDRGPHRRTRRLPRLVGLALRRHYARRHLRRHRLPDRAAARHRAARRAFRPRFCRRTTVFLE